MLRLSTNDAGPSTGSEALHSATNLLYGVFAAILDGDTEAGEISIRLCANLEK